MSNDYYNNTISLSAFTLAKAEDIDGDLNTIAAGFDKLPAPHAGAPTTKGFSEVFKVIDATNEDNPAPVSQLRDAIFVGTDTGTANTYAVTLAPVPGSYTTGMLIIFKPLYSNTGACTVNVNAMGAKSIKSTDGGDPAANEIYAGNYVVLIYDGTYFQILTASMTAFSVASETIPAPSGVYKPIRTNAAGTAYELGDAIPVPTGSYKNLRVNAAGTAYEIGIPSIGEGQTLQSVKTSRSLGSTYTNSTGAPIFVWVTASSVGAAVLDARVDGLIAAYPTIPAGGSSSFNSIIPAGSTYKVTATGGTLTEWLELR